MASLMAVVGNEWLHGLRGPLPGFFGSVHSKGV